jgi:hypothetical protein
MSETLIPIRKISRRKVSLKDCVEAAPKGNFFINVIVNS